MKPITEIAAKAGINNKYGACGKYKAKIGLQFVRETDKEDGELILVSAIEPHSRGEGKTTRDERLVWRVVCGDTRLWLPSASFPGTGLRVKGGAAGGGSHRLSPMEDVNLHFTGDFHAIGAANNPAGCNAAITIFIGAMH